MNKLPQHHAVGPSEARGPMQLHRLHRQVGPVFKHFSCSTSSSFSFFSTCLQFTGVKMRKWHEIDFVVKHFAIRFGCVTLVETCCCWNVDMCKLQKPQNYESRERHANSSKALQQTYILQFRPVTRFQYLVGHNKFLRGQDFCFYCIF